MLSFLFDLAVIFLEVCLIELSVCVLSHLSRVGLFVTLWTIARQAPLSMRFSRQEYCSGLPFPFPSDLSDPGIKPASPPWQVDSSPLEISTEYSLEGLILKLKLQYLGHPM